MDVEERSSSLEYYRMEVNADREEIAEKRWTARLATPPEPPIGERPPHTHRDFLVGRPSASHSSLTGRGMKGYV